MTSTRFSLLIVLCFSVQLLLAQSPVELHGKLRVSGNRIVNEQGQVVSFSGNSFFWSNTGWEGNRFYNSEVVGWLVNDWKTTIVRAAIGADGPKSYLSDSTNKDRIVNVIDGAINNGIYVVIDWHSHHAENNTDKAVEFFTEMAKRYGEKPNVIYEIYNEPLNISWSQTLKPYSESVIKAIRAIDPDNLIVVGTPNWSQDVDVASADPIIGYSNLVYSLHFYAGTHKQGLRDKAEIALKNGVPLMITEWGTVNADGKGKVDEESTREWREFMLKNGITNINWSVCDKNEGASIVSTAAASDGSWTDDQLTPSGLYVREFIRGWKP